MLKKHRLERDVFRRLMRLKTIVENADEHDYEVQHGEKILDSMGEIYEILRRYMSLKEILREIMRDEVLSEPEKEMITLFHEGTIEAMKVNASHRKR